MTFDFTEHQVAQIMQTLAQRPYAEVFDLIATIQRQATAQAQQQRQQQPAGPRAINGTGEVDATYGVVQS